MKHGSKALLVLAGPGTGKTEVLTHRISYLVKECGVSPSDIVAVTFSRKAAREMADRLTKSFGLEEMHVSTLHAEALRLLTEVGHGRKFLLGSDETRLLVSDAAQDLGHDCGFMALRLLESGIRLCKANNRLPNDVDDVSFGRVYARYEDLLDFNKAIDLDGLVMRAVRALFSRGAISLPNNGGLHLLVDEFQDVNQAMYQLIRVLAGKAETLFVVGDDDQSIYSWRGADPNIIRNFKKDFSASSVEILEESHRCTGHILEGAYAIVSKDPECIEKPLHSSKGDGLPIIILVSKSWTVEAFWIANSIDRYLSEDAGRPCDVAVLTKTLSLAEHLAEQLRIARIPTTYWRSGGILSDRDVLDVLAHIRLVADNDDNLALRRCLTTSTGFGVGRVAERKLCHLAEKNVCSLWEVMATVNEFSQLRRWKASIEKFVAKVDKMEEVFSDLELDKIVKHVAKEMDTDKLSNIKKLEVFAESLSDDSDLDDLVGELNRRRGVDLAGGGPEPETEEDAVAIMSMHSAKGLGYKIVFILGMDRAIMPDPNQDENEQRRLCYVAMTRAKERLFLCHSRWRSGPATRGRRPCLPSKFLLEIPKQHMKVVGA